LIIRWQSQRTVEHEALVTQILFLRQHDRPRILKRRLGGNQFEQRLLMVGRWRVEPS